MINKFVPHQGAQKSDACQGHLPERLKFIGDHDIQMFILEALVLYSIDRQYIESAKHQKTGKLMEIEGSVIFPFKSYDFPMQACTSMTTSSISILM